MLRHRPTFAPLLALLALLVCGSASAASADRDPRDPYESFNRSMFAFNNKLDRWVLKPLAVGYDKITPRPVDRAISNFFGNLDDTVVIFQDLLQGKPDYAVQGFARVIYNTVFGLFGFIDVASHMDAPKRNEDFGQTFAVWGSPAGPYLVLPLIGPSGVRDGIGAVLDSATNPVGLLNSSNQRIGLTVLRIVDRRADLLGAERVFTMAALDPYVFAREAYLQRRENLIYDGDPPLNDLDGLELLDEEDALGDAPLDLPLAGE
jgi:phospholipid-binding lipoprotein MlaA